MNKTKQREEMLEYIVAKLTEGGETAEPFRKKLIGNRVSRYIKVGPSEKPTGIVLLCDRTYTADDFKTYRESAKKQYENMAIIFLKDGETYFRTAAPKAHFKRDGRSLKEYTTEEAQKIMMLRPEEIHAVHRKSGGTVQYYQPESERLKQGLVEYAFQTVQFDYGHVENDRFQPRDATSKRLYIWTNQREHEGPVKLEERGLVFVPKQIIGHACADMHDEFSSGF